MTFESTLNGSVQAQGLRVSIEHWLVMGSKEWNETPDEVKAWAYQAAGVTGWTDAALKMILMEKHKHIDDDMANVTLDLLKDLAKEHKLETK